ncbi:MAG: hypothetical protein PVH91_10230 [Pseudomonadales bacterium]|jgi:hypothetical protein
MAIEEITLSVPQVLPDSGIAYQSEHERQATGPDLQVGRRYRQILRERDRFTWTRRGRARREEVFDVAYRSLVKQMAKDATEAIRDRSARLQSRTRIYATLTELLTISAEDQRRARYRARRTMTWGIGLAAFGLTCVCGVLLLALR